MTKRKTIAKNVLKCYNKINNVFLIFQKENNKSRIEEGRDMKKMWKKLTMLGITLSGMMYSTMSFAAQTGFDPGGFQSSTGTATDQVQRFGQNILGIVSMAASILAIIILIVLGVKYMMGSAEEKAEYKKTLLPYFIGAFFVFGAGAICTVIFNMAGQSWT